MSTPYRRNAKTPAGRIAATPSTANWGGFFGLLQEYAGAAAGYSLRKIGSGPVVRLRRASDNEEKDFAAGELTGSVVGSQVILNPEFDSATGWATTGGWSITGGQAVNSGTDGNLQQGSRVTVGNYYIATLEIVACSNFADLRVRLGAAGAYALSDIGITTTGTHQIAFQAQSVFFLIQTTNSATATIEFAGCEEYTPTTAEQWTIEGEGNTTQLFSYATTWYNQADGGVTNNATQATAAAQPLLILAGVTNTDNGKPALSFDGTDDRLVMGSSIEAAGSFQISAVSRSANATAARRLLDAQPENEFFRDQNGGVSNVAQLVGGAAGQFSSVISGRDATTQNLLTFERTSATAGFAYNNGTSATAQTYGSGTMSVDSISTYDAASQQFIGNIQEVIIYPSDQSANRTGIETNINDHYGIY